MKIRPVGAELLHADGQTDKTKQMVGLCNFANTLTHQTAEIGLLNYATNV